ncbi:DgyrCDS11183 [Dimorphilus gyrociliatus]|uniref:DgyrCDS11183 n=1 Tax=Dimorphilus gyrociliatus TaxID=2664684 RepID=A0A7I8W2I1_9ANNE|nr:DgyrCDS11183 [Dimorphilus gyrociliatus]
MQGLEKSDILHKLYQTTYNKGANLLRTIDNNPELDRTVKKTSDNLTDTVHTIANEPSLAFFRIEEHVRKNVPLLVHHKHGMEEKRKEVSGACYDMEYAITETDRIKYGSPHLGNTKHLMKDAIFYMQQLNAISVKNQSSRLSRTQTVDMSDSRFRATNQSARRPRSSSLTSSGRHQTP